MTGTPHRTLVPLAAFLATLGLAWWMTAGAESSPAVSLHRAVTAYHRALETGDVEEASRFVADQAEALPRAQQQRAGEWKSTLQWAVGPVDIAPDGRSANVGVQRLEKTADVPGRVLVVEKEAWRRAGEGAWGLVGWEVVGRAPAQ